MALENGISSKKKNDMTGKTALTLIVHIFFIVNVYDLQYTMQQDSFGCVATLTLEMLLHSVLCVLNPEGYRMLARTESTQICELRHISCTCTFTCTCTPITCSCVCNLILNNFYK